MIINKNQNPNPSSNINLRKENKCQYELGHENQNPCFLCNQYQKELKKLFKQKHIKKKKNWHNLIWIGLNEGSTQALGDFLPVFKGFFGGFSVRVQMSKPRKQHQTAQSSTGCIENQFLQEPSLSHSTDYFSFCFVGFLGDFSCGFSQFFDVAMEKEVRVQGRCRLRGRLWVLGE